jgi:hypothetical protein
MENTLKTTRKTGVIELGSDSGETAEFERQGIAAPFSCYRWLISFARPVIA